ncbi:MAG TPA: hypothetical protein VNT55_23350, partial [Baekduia sp.]|nr:hypothetical protein [Baekduia sp.]
MDGDQGLIATRRRSAGRTLADLLHGRRRLQAGLLLAGPLGWLVVAYLGSLAVLFVAAFWSLDEFSGQIVHSYSLANFQTLWEGHVYREIVLRTVGIAAAVTVTDVLLAFPIAFYMAKVATPRGRAATPTSRTSGAGAGTSPASCWPGWRCPPGPSGWTWAAAPAPWPAPCWRRPT